MLRGVILTSVVMLVGATADAQQGSAGGQKPAEEKKAHPNEAGGLEGIGQRIFEALNRHRKSRGIPHASFSPRIHIALQDHVSLMVKRGYRGGPVRTRGRTSKYPKLTTRTRERHGWNLSLYDNYSNGKKGGMDADSIIKVLQAHPSIRSLLRKDLNVGAAAAAPVPDSDDYVIVVGLMRGPKKDMKNLPRVAAAEKAWAKADDKKRKSIVKGLAGFRNGDGLLLLTRALADKAVDVRKEAAKAVGKLGDCWPVPKLLDQLETEKDEKVKTELQKALTKISGQKGYDDLRKWRVWWSIERDIFVKRKR